MEKGRRVGTQTGCGYSGGVKKEGKSCNMGGISGDDFEFGIIFQAPSCIWGAIGVLEFPGVFHKVYP